MWGIKNQTSYAADRTWIRDKNGDHQWVVVTVASFTIDANGSLRLADEQRPPAHLPEYRGEDGQSSLVRDADLGPMKPATDVIVRGTAVAPRGQPHREFPIGLRCRGIEKVLLVRGPTTYRRSALGLTTTRPEPVVSQEVVYEAAFGGPGSAVRESASTPFDERNPVGVGFRPRSGDDAPRVVYPGRDPSRAGPACFGAVATHWLPRRQLAGTYDASWARSRRPLLPADYDERFALCAPTDQVTHGYLEPGEGIEVVNMSVDGVLRIPIPSIALRYRTRVARRSIETSPHLATIDIDTNRRTACFAWQHQLRVGTREVEQLDETVVVEA